ncbi:unnamed protein product [Pleuronectes platessa]|uniref:Uncharacterized protein n=1 Tax=Pleuronectes platessa TaxID=8262 RepID=A0A9N7UIJ1_PLEPL|nr:unnamed protein product [Pleuronectes platessa]
MARNKLKKNEDIENIKRTAKHGSEQDASRQRMTPIDGRRGAGKNVGEGNDEYWRTSLSPAGTEPACSRGVPEAIKAVNCQRLHSKDAAAHYKEPRPGIVPFRYDEDEHAEEED